MEILNARTDIRDFPITFDYLAQCGMLAGFIKTTQAEEMKSYKIISTFFRVKTEKWRDNPAEIWHFSWSVFWGICNVLLLIMLHHGVRVQKPPGDKFSPLGKIFIRGFVFLLWHKWQFSSLIRENPFLLICAIIFIVYALQEHSRLFFQLYISYTHHYVATNSWLRPKLE